MDEQHLPADLAVRVKPLGGLRRKGHGCGAAEALVVGAELAAEGLGHRREASLGLEGEPIALGRREALDLVPGLGDLVVGARVAEVELNPLLAEQDHLHGPDRTSELVHGGDFGAVDLCPGVEVEVVGSLDGPAGRDLVDAAVLPSFARRNWAVAAVLSAVAAGLLTVAGIVAAGGWANSAILSAGCAVFTTIAGTVAASRS